MPAIMRQAFVGVGANVGDRWANIRAALAELARESGISAVELSAIYETAPVGGIAQPDFLNLVAGLETTLTSETLHDILQARERAAGRRREQTVRWGPRTLDLDLLLYENEIRDGPGLILPHPRLWERAFVLAPLAELLARCPRFHRPAWNDLRARLLITKFAAEGIARWTPPAAP
jgi:2-amino-4-hydroxy-6-hydroxymethyldihydropteridine diphosphokinase